MEQAETFELFDNPKHPYTLGLMNAVDSLEKKQAVLDTIPGTVPNLLNLPDGCSFAPRCGMSCEQCCAQVPELHEVAPGHLVRCHMKGQEV